MNSYQSKNYVSRGKSYTSGPSLDPPEYNDPPIPYHTIKVEVTASGTHLKDKGKPFTEWIGDFTKGLRSGYETDMIHPKIKLKYFWAYDMDEARAVDLQLGFYGEIEYQVEPNFTDWNEQRFFDEYEEWLQRFITEGVDCYIRLKESSCTSVRP